jgi:hypothetical protein
MDAAVDEDDLRRGGARGGRLRARGSAGLTGRPCRATEGRRYRSHTAGAEYIPA